jgi:hypothetical protein
MDGIYQLVIGGVDTKGEYAENVSHWKLDGTLSGTSAHSTAFNLCTHFNTTDGATLLACIAPTVKLNILNAKRVDGPGGPTAHYITSQSGTGAGNSYTMAVAAAISFSPGGALNRLGRWFLWGLSNSNFVDGLIDAGFLAAIQAFCNVLITPLALTVGTATFGTWTKKTNTFNAATDYEVAEKATGMTKRTRPVT